MHKVNNNNITKHNKLTLSDYTVECDLIIDGIAAELGPDRLLMTDTFNGAILRISAQVFNVHTSGKSKPAAAPHNFGSCIDTADADIIKGLFDYYCNLCLKYNQKPYAIQFFTMINISYNTYKEWLFGSRNVSADLMNVCRYINQTEEMTQVAASDVKSMFRLKSMHGYCETPQVIQVFNAPIDDVGKLMEKYKHMPIADIKNSD